MNLSSETKHYQETLSFWAGCKISLDDDFDLFCQNDFDFIEILMLFEKEFLLNLLDSAKARCDFEKVEEFISWAVSQPSIEQSFVFSFYNRPKVLPLSEVDDQGRDFHVRSKIESNHEFLDELTSQKNQFYGTR